MCDAVADFPSASWNEWRRARKEHVCCACGEAISPGHRYHHTRGIWDGEPGTFKHCARCWLVLEELFDRAGGDAVDLLLDCGMSWADCHDPEDEPADLAFVTPAEAQELLRSAP